MHKDVIISKFKLALITGASSGIGESLCNLLAEKGINLLISGRNSSHLTELADKLEHRVEVTVVPADLTIVEDREKILEIIRNIIPDLVINNAGFGLYGEALDYPTKKQMEIVQVNVNALLEISLESARSLKQAKREGVIVNISSAAAFTVFPCFSVYAAAKSFVLQFSESFDEEMKNYGIRVLASCPGRVMTHFQERASNGNLNLVQTKAMMSSTYAAEQIWRQIEKRKPVHIFDWKYRVGVFLLNYLIPKRLAANILRKFVAK